MGIFDKFKKEVYLDKSIGIVTSTGYVEFVPAHTNLPFDYSTIFSTYMDNQTAVQVKLQQQNQFGGLKDISCVVFGNVPALTKGIPQITISFSITKKKKLVIKALIAQTGYTQEFGPYSVE